MRRTWLVCWLLIPLAILGMLFHGQAQTPKVGPKTALSKPRDGNKLPDAAQPIFNSGQRAMEWLKRANRQDGRFVYGFQPSLRVELDGDNFVSQAGAAFALARAARYFGDESSTVRARGAILRLLIETMPDEKDASILYTAAPPFAVDRLSAHGLLVSAIHELDHPERCPDLLKKADQLCNYLRLQQRPDGSLSVANGKSGSDELDAERAGWALQGIIRSHQHSPADWKIDMVRKACKHYLAYWQKNKNIAVACSHTPAYAEAFRQSKDRAFADAVFAMNDWLIGLQYPEGADVSRSHWAGGFKRFRDGKQELAVPDITSAAPAESLADACRVAKQAADPTRPREYERALGLNFRFLLSLQYTMDKTRHFVDPFRPSILGAFHASHQDGNLRIDYTQHALCAMVQYLDKVVEQ